jgi:hypothetical protein
MMPDKGGRRQIFHVNHLKKWQERDCTVAAVIEEEERMEEYYWTNGRETSYGKLLTLEQKKDVDKLLSMFSSVTRETPGNTYRAVHKIRTMDVTPIRKRIREVCKKKVMDEMQEMEKNGIIEQSESESVSPMVIVTKKDGGV